MPTKRELEKNSEKYAMGLDIETTKHHPSYKATLSAAENYKRGLQYARKHDLSELWVARSLEQLANLTHKSVFREAAKMAYATEKQSKKRIRA